MLHDSKIKSAAERNKRKIDSLVASREGNGTDKQSMTNVKKLQDLTDAKAALVRGKVNPRQKTIHDSKIKSAANLSNKKFEVCAAIVVGNLFTEQKSVLVGLRKTEAKVRDAKLASCAEMLDDVENGTSDLKMVLKMVDR